MCVFSSLNRMLSVENVDAFVMCDEFNGQQNKSNNYTFVHSFLFSACLMLSVLLDFRQTDVQESRCSDMSCFSLSLCCLLLFGVSPDILRKLPGVNTHNLNTLLARVRSLYDLSLLTLPQLTEMLGPYNAKMLFDCLHNTVALSSS